jgi:hypothetical protein
MSRMPKSMKSRRGFASMKPETRSRIASLGGKAAHAQGKAHRFTHAEAVRAGKKSRQLHNANGAALQPAA